MKDYRDHSVEELATDKSFRKWVLNTNAETTAFWVNWTAANPHKATHIGLARELVLTVHDIYSDDLSDDMLAHEIEEITRLAELRNHSSQSRINWLTSKPLWRVAAIFLLVSTLGLWLYKTENNAIKPDTILAKTDVTPVMLFKKNDTAREMTVLLSDNSVATLSQGSTIRYPEKFSAKDRKVYLTGEAFFDVAKNPGKPFLVYTNETVTKVLGTSFRIKARDQENTVMVLVKTGQVSVYPKTDYEKLETRPDKAVTGIVLNPNQQAIFDKKQHTLEKGNVKDRQLLSELAIQKELIFDDKPVNQVFNTLQTIYGISILYDAETMHNCVISAQFSDENLKQRLNAICQAIDANYEMLDGRIVITGKGCN